MDNNECIKIYKTFIQPYFLYAIEAWGHSVQSENDILVKMQSKVLRVLFDSYRTTDAWNYTNGHIKDVKSLYNTVIKKLCMRHHFGLLPNYVSSNIMPEFNICQLDNKISRISLEHMYDYKNNNKIFNTHLKNNCSHIWNSLKFDIKKLPYVSGKESIHKALKTLN